MTHPMIQSERNDAPATVHQGSEPDITTTSGASANRKRSQRKCWLEKLVISPRFFWKQTSEEQAHLIVHQRIQASQPRKVGSGQAIVMALNEIASHRRRGFFFHTLPVQAFCTWPAADGHPVSRRPPKPGAKYPSAFYMNFTWSPETHASFATHSHEARFLKCDMRQNGPAGATPLYAIQIITFHRQPIYATATNTIVLVCSDLGYYVCSTAELQETIGMWKRQWGGPSGPDPDKRINSICHLWKSKDEACLTTLATWQRSVMAVYRLDTLEEAFVRVSQLCRPGAITATFTADDLKRSWPQASNPEAGLALGTQATRLVLDEERA